MAVPRRKPVRSAKKAAKRRSEPRSPAPAASVALQPLAPLDPKLEISAPEEEVVGRDLTPRQAAFVNRYVQIWNGTKAYQHAYGANMDDAVAAQAASRLLRNVKVRQLINVIAQRVAEQAEVTAGYVVQTAREVTERCLQRVPVMRFDHELKAMVQETTTVEGEDGEFREEGVWQFDGSTAVKALQLLAKHTGGFDADNPTRKQLQPGETEVSVIYRFAGMEIPMGRS